MTDEQTQAATDTIAAGEEVEESIAGGTVDEQETTATETTEESTQTEEAPVEYNLTAPEGVTLREGYVDSLTEFAKANNLSPEAVQELINQEAEAAQKAEEAFQQRVEQEQKEWVETVKADDEIGGEHFDQSKQLARKVIGRFGSELLVQELNDTGLGNHPELVRLLVRIGRSMADDTLATGKIASPESKPKTAEEIMYPDLAGGDKKE